MPKNESKNVLIVLPVCLLNYFKRLKNILKSAQCPLVNEIQSVVADGIFSQAAECIILLHDRVIIMEV